MIEIIQTGQFGKTSSLIDMHRLRKVIFKDKMGWDVDISQDELEIDNYDLPESVYIISRDTKKRAVGVWRLLPSTSPSMIRDIWPEFLEDISMPIDNQTWEVSRFGVHTYDDVNKNSIKQVNQITAEMISALVDVCMKVGIRNIYTLYNPQVGRSVRKIGFIPHSITAERPVDGKPTIVGHFVIDQKMQDRIRDKTGIFSDISIQDLPPVLQAKQQDFFSSSEEALYA